jgi:hypothetical protein
MSASMCRLRSINISASQTNMFGVMIKFICTASSLNLRAGIPLNAGKKVSIRVARASKPLNDHRQLVLITGIMLRGMCDDSACTMNDTSAVA